MPAGGDGTKSKGDSDDSQHHAEEQISRGLAVAIGLFGLLPGLLLGYVFYRTRSIWPGAIWHTSISGVALLFWPHT